MAETYGRRLMPAILQHVAKVEPQRTFALHAKTEDVVDGFDLVSFHQLSQAVNYVSKWLQTCFGQDAKPRRHETITYIGVPDLRYNIFFYAAIQCRCKVFLTSPRNPVAVNVSLFEQTECSKLVHAAQVLPVARALQSANPSLLCRQLPSLKDLLAVPSSEYEFEFDYADIYKEPVLILHSSGSTGLPKPVIHTHGTLATYDVRDWPTVDGFRNHDGLGTLRFPEPDSYIYDVFPPFHIAGFMTKIMVPIYNLTSPIFGPPTRPPSGSLAAAIVRLHTPRGAILPPTIAEQIFHEPGGPDLLRNLGVLLFAGGPLSPEIGDEISKYTTLCQFYGSTEAGQIRQLIPPPEFWSYFHFHPNESYQMQPASDGLFELVLFSDESLERTSSLYHNYPNVREWRTKDLFVPHPEQPHLWKFHARRDDILVLSSGEKLNPITMESCVSAFEGVNGALVVGQGHPQAALLLKLSPNYEFSSDPVQDLWPTIEHSNSLLPAHGRITKAMVILANPGKPFARAGKGTVVRRLTEELYATEIRRAYEEIQRPAQVTISLKPSAFTEADFKGLVRSALTAVAIRNNLSDSDNFYGHNMDSVKTVEVVGILKASLGPYKPAAELRWLTVETVFLNPTVDELSNVLLQYLNNGLIPKTRNRETFIKSTIERYINELPTKPVARKDKVDLDLLSVAITGTTGYLGPILLKELIANPHISKIYCLNRSSDAYRIFSQRYPGHTSNKIEFIRVNLGQSDLGLSSEKYASLLQNCSAIIHNAWRVDYNLSLSSFEDNLDSVKHLISLGTSSALRPRIFFVSSISATGIWSPKGSLQHTVPESAVTDPSAPLNFEYAESKFVGENLLHAAAEQVDVPVTVIRLGLVAPSSEKKDDDTWQPSDVIRVYLHTCRALGVTASDFLPLLDWVPVNWAASIIAEIVQKDIGSQTRSENFYNIVNPKHLPWRVAIAPIKAWCGKETEVVAMQQWMGQLRESNRNDTESLGKLPALRMMNMYDIISGHGLTHKYAMDNLRRASESLARMPAIDEQLIGMWLDHLNSANKKWI